MARRGVATKCTLVRHRLARAPHRRRWSDTAPRDRRRFRTTEAFAGGAARAAGVDRSVDVITQGTAVVLAAGAAFATAACLCSREEAPIRRAVVVAATALFCLGSLLALLLAFLLWARTCDESCGGATGWIYEQRAWQWFAQLALAAGAAAGAWMLPALVAARVYRPAIVVVAAATAAWLIWGWGFVAAIDYA